MYSINKILITGTTSGLGKYLYENIPNSISLNRKDTFIDNNFDVIIHNAFSPQGANKNDIKDYYKYINDNILLTKKLVDIKPKKFIYISTGDVYRDEFSLYKYTKLFAESIVKNEMNNSCILRCAAMLGKYMRPNTFTKILNDSNPILTLSKESKFNYVLHSDICKYILEIIHNDIKGTYNFNSTTYITLNELVKLVKGNPKYGKYTYTCPNMDLNIDKKFHKTSKQVIKEYIKNEL